MSNFECQLSNVKFKCQISNVTFQISNYKYHIEDNPSSATQQLIQNQVATFNISDANVKFDILNFKFQM